LIRIFDSFALLVYFNHQPGWEIVRGHLLDAEEKGFRHWMSAINFGEFYYIEAINNGFEHAEQSRKLAETFPIQIHTPTFEQVMEAAHLKGGIKASYADCFAAALAIEKNIPVLTGDREFERLEEYGLKIEWLPKNR
jgi:predicted nucleic acid-binding protein